jgi:hypothetical protein
MPGISINGVKSCKLSASGTEVHITFVSRYSGDFEVSMPLACRDELLALLTANGATRPSQPSAPAAAPAMPPARPIAATAPPARPIESPAPAPEPPAKPGQISVSVPKKWAVTADTSVHDVVLLLFNPNMDKQTGYALGPEAAKEMAIGLVKNADTVLAHKSSKKH